MLSKGIMQDKTEMKQFKTATGSPITYTRFKKHKGIYYPIARTHTCTKKKPKPLPRHVCIVYSKMYGREMYGNIDIWPDEDLKARLKAEKAFKALFSTETNIPLLDGDDVYEIQEHIDDQQLQSGEEDAEAPEPVDNNNQKSTRHVTITVTDTSEDGSSSTDDHQVHPAPAGHQDAGDGEWPIKRSQSVDSRDNPFLPGGNLSKEAEEILSRATIIRDTFILKDNGDGQPLQECENANGDAEKSPVSETMIANSASNAESAAVPNATEGSNDTRPKENGQLETDKSLTPVSDKAELDKDKKKQQKCCVVM